MAVAGKPGSFRLQRILAEEPAQAPGWGTIPPPPPSKPIHLLFNWVEYGSKCLRCKVQHKERTFFLYTSNSLWSLRELLSYGSGSAQVLVDKSWCTSLAAGKELCEKALQQHLRTS